MFPLIPLPIKEAVQEEQRVFRLTGGLEFPLIPLPIKEAVSVLAGSLKLDIGFPLIPLPIKEAVF